MIEIGLRGLAPALVVAIFDYLAWINVDLGVFNLIPGYPLDGGHIFCPIVCWKTGSLTWATKWASDIGQGFAWALMILGVVQFFGGGLVGGLSLILIGMFLRVMAGLLMGLERSVGDRRRFPYCWRRPVRTAVSPVVALGMSERN